LARSCNCCKSEVTYVDKKGKDRWHNHDGEWFCDKCNHRLFTNPITNKKWAPINNIKRQVFKGNRLYFEKKPRTGKCSECGNVKGKDCKRTSNHHWFYLIIMPWACTIELCNSCHRKGHWATVGQ
jgi:hypothetical protein